MRASALTQTLATNHGRLVITGLILLILGMILGRGHVAFGEAPRPTNSGEGLVLVAYTRGTFAFGADGASANADGTVSEVQKIFPVGKHGAVLFSGATSIQDPVERPVRQQLNIVRIAKIWLDAHPDADLPTAGHEICDAVSHAVTTFFAQRDPGIEAGHYKFTIVFAGFVEGKAVVMTTAYGIPLKGAVARTQTASDEATPGRIWMFGESDVAERLLRGDDGLLKEFQAEPGPVKYRTDREKMADSDYLSLFGTMLRASESAEGRQARHGMRPVAPPNRFAILTVEDGLQAR
jgi:hypothetical protein